MKPESVNINSMHESSVNLYPNPAMNYFSVTTGNINIASVYIYNLQGSMVKEVKNSDGNTIDISNIPSGTYFVKFKYASGQVSDKKLIVIK